MPDPHRPQVMSLVKANSLPYLVMTAHEMFSWTLSNSSLVMIGVCLPVYHLTALFGVLECAVVESDIRRVR